ncbi:MAG TPA: MmgE/PrpD family protein, partial [Bryobacteraceae bacterium]|nr:MmgE/PrpD family protein [Bryobacteraceae bacterium]
MTQAQQMAEYSVTAEFSRISPEALDVLKMHVLDSVGCAIAAIDGGPVQAIRRFNGLFSAPGSCTLIGGGSAALDRAVFYNSALVRYVDFMDNYMSAGETCHPSDNFGAVLGAAEYAGCSGREFLTALALAYHVQCVITAAAPIMRNGFDHTTQQAYSVACGVARALGLNAEQTANAIGITGTSSVALAVTRTGRVPHWKGLAAAQTAMVATQGTLLAREGITGPLDVIEGTKGFEEALGKRLNVNWSEESLDAVLATSIKRYNAEVHAQSCIEGVLEMRRDHGLDAAQISDVQVDIFQVAYDIIGGGEFGDRQHPQTKEEADHSLPYMVATALIDGDLLPGQYEPRRIASADVQSLSGRVKVSASRWYTWLYPKHLGCRITVALDDGREFSKEKKTITVTAIARSPGATQRGSS